MKCGDQSTFDECRGTSGGTVCRRQVMGSAGVAVFGLLTGSAFGREQEKEPGRDGPPREVRERIEQFRAYSERMRNASAEERIQIMMEQRVQEHQRAIEELKDRLGISDKEWAVVKPRIEKVYNLVHPLPQVRRGDAPPRTELERRRTELRELLRSAEAPTDQIKAKLTALRAAQEQARQELATARQSLRQLMTVRQEAELVLSGLLD